MNPPQVVGQLLEEEALTIPLDESAVEMVSRGVPTWLTSRRRHAWSVYENTPLPTTRSEEWRYTDLSRLINFGELRLATGELPPENRPLALDEAIAEDRVGSGHIVLMDGGVIHVDLDPALAASGVVLTSLRAAVEEHAEILEAHLATEALPPEQ